MAPRSSQEGSWGDLGSSWGGLGPLLGAFGPSLDGLGGLLGRLDGVLGCFWELLGPLWNGLGSPLMFIVYVDCFCCIKFCCGCLVLISVLDVYA